MHKGDIGFGHYFAYIRPTLEDEWYEFNDQRVTPVIKGVIFQQAFGGRELDFDFRKLSFGVKTKINKESAYMLVYLKKSMINEIMTDKLDIPPQL